MQSKSRNCTIKFVEGVVTAASAHATAWTAVATITYLWQFIGHVVADAGFHLFATFAGY